MRILFVFTGGTIGCTLSLGGIIAPEAQKAYKIIKAYSHKYTLDFDYDIVEPYTELSENNTGEHIALLCASVKERLDGGYDGIIVTHGTDTLQYTAAALGYTLGSLTIPVCIVSANKPIEHSQSNGLINLHAAVCFIRERVGKGVFVPYRNAGDDSVYIHRGTRLLSAKTFSDDLASAFDKFYGYYNGDFEFIKNPTYSELPDAMLPLDAGGLSERSKSISVISAYPGMVYPEIRDGLKYILLGSYHSGTVDTRSKMAREFFLDAKKKGVRIYVTGVTDGPEYESAALFEALSITPIKNISPIAAYIKLWLLSSEDCDITEKLTLSLGADVVS